MAGRNLTLTALRALDTRLQNLAGFIHRQVEQIEKRAEPAPFPAFETPDSSLSQSRPEGPPAHWLERVRQAVPGFHDPAVSGPEPAPPFEFKAGAVSEQVINPQASSNPVTEESPVEAKPDSYENKTPSKLAPKFSFRTTHRAKPLEKVSPEDKKVGEDSREGEGVADKLDAKVKRTLSRRARIVFPGYGSERDTKNSKPTQYSGSPDESAYPASSEVVNTSASSTFREGGQSLPKTGKEDEVSHTNLAGHSSGSQPEILSSPKYGIGEEPGSSGQTMQNKAAPNYSNNRKSSSPQPETTPFQANSSSSGDFQPSRPGHNLKFGLQPATKLQNQSGSTPFGAVEKKYSQSQAQREAVSNELFPKAPQYWSGERDKETLSGRKGQDIKISPFQSEVDINKDGKGYRPWPELPEETPVEDEANNWQQVRRKMEHFRRLDEEQRGTYGAGSLFN